MAYVGTAQVFYIKKRFTMLEILSSMKILSSLFFLH